MVLYKWRCENGYFFAKDNAFITILNVSTFTTFYNNKLFVDPGLSTIHSNTVFKIIDPFDIGDYEVFKEIKEDIKHRFTLVIEVNDLDNMEIEKDEDGVHILIIMIYVCVLLFIFIIYIWRKYINQN